MRSREKGFSLIELLIVVAIILIIAAIAIPNLLRSRMAANEASAVGSLRTINTACVTYSTTYGVGFPSQLSYLGSGGGGGTVTSTGSQLLDDVLASGSKSGYTFTYSAGAASGTVIPTYSVTANPITYGQTGLRYFFTDQSGVIRFNTSQAASASDSPLQ